MEENLDLQALNEKFSRLEDENIELSEALNNVSMMLDNAGWNKIHDIQSAGMSLYDLNRAAEQLRELAIGNPLLKRGYKLRSSYIWSRGFNLPKLTPQVKNRITSPVNERCMFSPISHEELELSAYTDGNVFVLGRESDQQLMRVPLAEISGVMTDPDNNEVIWALRRTWTRQFAGSGTAVVSKWYYTDTYPANQPKARNLKTENGTEEVDLGYTMFHQAFNSQVGWTFGVPDALSVIAWARLYREYLENGAIMTKALAQFAYKVSTKSRAGVNNAAAKIAVADGQKNRIGATAAMGSDVDLTPVSKGSGYDFEAGKSLAAMIASGLEVSIVALLADPSSSGSYGTAQTLDTPTMKAMQARQNVWSLFYKRILRFLGAPKTIDVTWPSIEVEPTHRMVQALAMAWESGILNKEEYRAAIVDILDVVETSPNAPSGVMLPNNTQYAATKSNDANPDGGVVPAQGVSGKVGSVTDNNSARNADQGK
jgi:hypothetical protein